MSHPLHLLILLGFAAQTLSADDLLIALGGVGLWFGGLAARRWNLRLGQAMEGIALVAGCAAGWLACRAAGESTHFFLGYGLMGVQAVRMTRPLDSRERLTTLVIALFHLGVGCATILDLRFIPVLLAAVVLVPRAFQESALEEFGAEAAPAAAHPGPAIPVLVGLAAVGFFAVFPRHLLGSAFQPARAGLGTLGTLADAVVDPSRSGLRQSTRTLLQIEGEKPGYLRCLALGNFDGRVWSAGANRRPRPLPETADAALFPLRRVRVKHVGFLGRILPVDGHVVQLTGRFFREPVQNGAGAIECSMVWNTLNNVYEYRIDPAWRGDAPTAGERRVFTQHPAMSDRLRVWLAQTLDGTADALAQARRLEAHLRDHFKYSLGAPELGRINALEEFLFERREGHCERFASSLALLLRMRGIPSRVVVGYVPGPRNPFSGWHTVRFRDAHAWTEAWIDERGWVQLDATPRSSVGAEEPGSGLRNVWEAIDAFWYSRVIDFDVSAQQRLVTVSLQGVGRTLAWVRGRAGWMLGALVLVIGVWLGARLGRARRFPFRRSAARSDRTFAEHVYGRMLRVLARHDLERQRQETPLEFLARIEPGPVPLFGDIRLITETFCASRYGSHPATADQLLAAEEALGRLRRAGSGDGQPREPAGPLRAGGGGVGQQGKPPGIVGSRESEPEWPRCAGNSCQAAQNVRKERPSQ